MNQQFDMKIEQEQALLFLLNFLKQHYYQFITITPLTHLQVLKIKQKQLLNTPTLEDIFGWNLAFSAQDLNPQLFNLLKDAALIYPVQDNYLSHIRVASFGQELAVHSAFPTVEKDAVFFGPDTYRFGYHLKQFLIQQSEPPKRGLELCCGTSAVAIAVAQLCPEISEIITVDINPKALFYSQVNIKAAGLTQIYPRYSDLFTCLEGNFDLIFANPPYLIDPDERQYRHGGHDLDGAELSLQILKQGITRLNPKGTLFLYTGIAIRPRENRFLHALQQWMKDYPAFQYCYEEIDPDIFGEELKQPAYQHIERIAAVLVKITAI